MDKRVFAGRTAFEPQAIEAAVEGLFAQLPAAGRLGPGVRVLIKPNLLSKNAPEKAVTTHPHVLRAVILAVRRRGATDITVADSPGGPYTPAAMRSVYEGCGLAAVCRETGAAAYTACETTHKAGGGQLVKEFHLLKPVVEADFIINLPKLKTHVLTGFSGAVKNLLGCVPGLEKAEFHMRFPQREHFGQMLVDLCETVRPDIHLVDGVLAMEGEGPGSGTPRLVNLLLAGEDPYSVDLAICRTMGLAPMDTPVMAAAHAQGLCAQAFDEALLVGDTDARRPEAGFVPASSYTGNMNFSARLPGFLKPLLPAFTQWAAPRPAVKKALCIGCGKCAEICPQQVIDMADGKAHIRYKQCIRCFCCHEMCPVRAIEVRRNRLFRSR
ncbi:MAG: DUF362 domain-containing protein [Ruminococcaceae bacterium]|nr:DUF362 domain-containing protein [Oscillospiraceae bacterium]